ncbi:MAG: polysaccharide biosynthesis tyrosine autokinase [Rhodothermales bacterium]
MQHQESDQNYLPVYSEAGDYESDMLPGNGMPLPPYAPEHLQEDSQLKELLDLLYAGKWLILGSFLAIFVITAIYTYMQVPLYKAHSLVLLDNRLAPDLKDALEAGPNSMGSSSRSVDTEVYVLQRSLGVSRRVSTRLGNIGVDPVTGNTLSLLSYGLPVEQLAGVVKSRIEVNREPVADVLRISAASTEPGEARLLADLYAEEFVDHALGRSRSRLASTRFFLENEAGKRKRELESLEEEMRQFMARNSGITLTDGTASIVSQVADLETLRDEVQLEIRMKAVLRDDLIEDIQTMQPHLAEQLSANVPARIERVQDAIAEVEDILDLIYRKNPGLRETAAAAQSTELQGHLSELARLRNTLQELTTQYVQQIEVFGGESTGSPGGTLQEFGRLRRQLIEEDQERERLKARVDIVNRQLGTFQAQLQGLPAQTIKLTQLKRSISTTERAFLLLNEKLEDVRISEESEQGYAEIILKAELPYRPEFPNKPKNLILGGLIGLLIGLGLAVIRQQVYKNVVMTPEDLKKQGFSIMGVIPSMRDYIKEQYQGVKLVEHNGYLNDSCLISLQPPSSFVTDAYRRLRFNIQRLQGEGVAQAILVTSPNPGEGKSITALNLAIASAQAGKRTVILDTDLRRPSIHEKLGIECDPGFPEMIKDRRLQFRRALGHMENLYVLTAGRATENSGEVMSSKEMPQLIQELKKLFDMVILDSPPFMLVSDPLVLSTMCDGTVIVACAGKTKQEDLHQGLHELQKVGGSVLGVLLNEFNPIGLYGARNKYKYYRYINNYSYQKEADALLQS